MKISFSLAEKNEDTSRAFLSQALTKHQTDIGALKEYARKNAGDRMVFIAGSLTEGLSNQYSDADIFCVDDGIETAITEVGNINKLRVDMERWPSSELRRIAMLFDDANNIGKPLKLYPEKTLEVAYRFASGLPLHKEEAVRLLQKSLPLSRLQIYMIRYWISSMDNDLQDSIGAYRSEDWDYAFVRARDGISHMMEGLLASQGDCNIKSKYLTSRIKRGFGRDGWHFKKYIYYNSLWPENPAIAAEIIEDMLRHVKKARADLQERLSKSPDIIFAPSENVEYLCNPQ